MWLLPGYFTLIILRVRRNQYLFSYVTNTRMAKRWNTSVSLCKSKLKTRKRILTWSRPNAKHNNNINWCHYSFQNVIIHYKSLEFWKVPTHAKNLIIWKVVILFSQYNNICKATKIISIILCLPVKVKDKNDDDWWWYLKTSYSSYLYKSSIFHIMINEN